TISATTRTEGIRISASGTPTAPTATVTAVVTVTGSDIGGGPRATTPTPPPHQGGIAGPPPRVSLQGPGVLFAPLCNHTNSQGGCLSCPRVCTSRTGLVLLAGSAARASVTAVPSGPPLHIRTTPATTADSSHVGMKVGGVVDDPVTDGHGRVIIPRGASAMLE